MEASTFVTSEPSVLTLAFPFFPLEGVGLGGRDWKNGTDNGTSESELLSGIPKSQLYVPGCIAMMPAYQPNSRGAAWRRLENHQARFGTAHPVVSGKICRAPGLCIPPYSQCNEVLVLSCLMGIDSLCSILPSRTALVRDSNPLAHYLATLPLLRPTLLVLGYLRSYLTIHLRLPYSNRPRSPLEGL